MEDSFTIDVDYEEIEYSFEARLIRVGYTHKFLVTINGVEVVYEPDEERNYRAFLNHPDKGPVKDIDKELIRMVGEKIQSIQ